MDSTEKVGGKPHRAYNSLDFIRTMEVGALVDIGCSGPRLTWCNNRRPRKRIWKRLDRIFINDNWAQMYNHNMVKHLTRTGSDHRPLLLKCYNDQNHHIKYFRFLNFWVKQPDFMEVVQQVWNTTIEGNHMWKLQSKLKLLRKKVQPMV